MPGACGARVELRDFGWHYPGRDAAALTDVSLTIEAGERVLLLGPSGSGKSTLLQALAGVEQDPDGQSHRGELTVAGVDPRDARGRVGFMHQDPETQVVLARVGDDVAFGLENTAVPRERIWPRVAGALEQVGLDLPLDHPTTQLSGGQKQRLALAGTMAMRPELLLLDEPTASVDPRGAGELRDAVARAVTETGTTLVVVEHRVALWEAVIDRVIMLDAAGRVAFDGPTREVLDEARDLLQDQGTWVPGWTPPTAAPPTTAPAPTPPATGGPTTVPAGRAAAGPAGGTRAPASPNGQLLRAVDLGVSRTQPPARAVARRHRRVRAAHRRGGPVTREHLLGDVPPVAAGLDVSVRAGCALAITGPNGAGKSTLALTLAGLLLPVRGAVHATQQLAREAPEDPSVWSGDQLVTRIGTVFQHPEHQFLCTTVRKELEFGPQQVHRRGGPPPDEARIEYLLERLRLTELQEANPFTLSGGQKRRLSVATQLASAPDVVILDEPTFGQDARTWQELADLLIEQLHAGTAVVVVTHDRELVRALGAVELELDA